MDPTQPLNIQLFQHLCRVGLGVDRADPAEVQSAQQSMTQYKEHPLAYGQVAEVMQNSACPFTRFFAVGVLEAAIIGRWNLFSEEEKLSIRQFLIQFMSHLCDAVDSFQGNAFLLTKVNTVLLQTVKREWPQRWPSFVAEMTQIANRSPLSCLNILNLFRLLSEEIFEFEEKLMTRRWVERRRAALATDFNSIYGLCVGTLSSASDPALHSAALGTLEKFIGFVDSAGFFSESFLGQLCGSFLANPTTMLNTLKCLSALAVVKHSHSQVQLLAKCVESVIQFLSSALAASNASESLEQRALRHYSTNPSARPILETAVSFFCGAFTTEPALLDLSDQTLLDAHRVILAITALDASLHKDIIGTCLDYWRWWTEFLVLGTNSGQSRHATSTDAKAALTALNKIFQQTDTTLRIEESSGGAPSQRQPFFQRDPPPLADHTANLRRKFFPLLESLRRTLIGNMIKPEEVILFEDDAGQLVTQYLKDVEAIVQFRLLRQLLIFLTMMDPNGMMGTIKNALSRQVDGSEYSWSALNRICWAMGALSGSMASDREDDFFVEVLKELLDFCANKKGKEHRAVIATNIMYVTGQYPRFLLKHPRFFRTVCRKLFDFMKETYPGIKDMAVDTILKLARLIPEAFVQETPGRVVSEIAETFPHITRDLLPNQLYSFYEAVGIGIFHVEPPTEQRRVLNVLCAPIHARLAALYQATSEQLARQPVSVTDETLVHEINELLHIERIFCAIAKYCGPSFFEEMSLIQLSLQTYYTHYSALMAQAVTQFGERGTQMSTVRLMKAAKREYLRLMEYFVTSTTHLEYIGTQLWPILMGAVLSDYASSPPCLRESVVLSLLTACVEKLGAHLGKETGTILDRTFEITKGMIAVNFIDYPEHRLHLFRLLGALNRYCFDNLLDYCTTHTDIVDGMLWAADHTEGSVMTAGLTLLASFLQHIANSALKDGFFTHYFEKITVSILKNMLDTMHTNGFSEQCAILAILFSVSLRQESNPESPYSPSSVRSWLATHLSALPSFTQSQTQKYIAACFQLCGQPTAFAMMQADFLIESRIWGAEMENKLLDAEGFSGDSQHSSFIWTSNYQPAAHIPGVALPSSIDA